MSPSASKATGDVASAKEGRGRRVALRVWRLLLLRAATGSQKETQHPASPGTVGSPASERGGFSLLRRCSAGGVRGWSRSCSSPPEFLRLAGSRVQLSLQASSR